MLCGKLVLHAQLCIRSPLKQAIKSMALVRDAKGSVLDCIMTTSLERVLELSKDIQRLGRSALFDAHGCNPFNQREKAIIGKNAQ